MISLQEVAQRRAYLLDLLGQAEEDLKSLNLRPKVRAAGRQFCVTISYAIQELELVLGMRNATSVDLGNV